ncbi:hypothetical protein ACQ4LE_001729 [Meloidogyne hapla]|uniref:G_PROTEIN_RECEP_F1_2 domain-containing protein n=1 Tax=Meloidogyne hapla TaxID=6305 RepID=A0A1I8B3W3_MELHA
MNSSPSICYKAFAGVESKIIYPIFIPALILFILSIIGIPLNASFCYITIKYRSKYSTLKSKTSKLLFINCIGEILSQKGTFYFFYISATGINFVPFNEAFKWQFLPLFGGCVAFSILMSISLDRLFAVSFPIFYQNIKTTKHMTAHIILLSTITSLVCALMFEKYNETLNVCGLPPEMIMIMTNPLIYIIQTFILSVTIISYICVAILVKIKTDLTNEKMKKFNRSIFLIVLFNVSSYILGSIIFNIVNNFQEITPTLEWYSVILGTIYVNIGIVGIAPIVYINSSDYRKAYHEEFRKLLKLIKRNNQVNVPINNIVVMKGPQIRQNRV